MAVAVKAPERPPPLRHYAVLPCCQKNELKSACRSLSNMFSASHSPRRLRPRRPFICTDVIAPQRNGTLGTLSHRCHIIICERTVDKSERRRAKRPRRLPENSEVKSESGAVEWQLYAVSNVLPEVRLSRTRLGRLRREVVEIVAGVRHLRAPHLCVPLHT